MNLYSLKVRNADYEQYSEFLITAKSIPDALEYMYEYTCIKDEGYEPVIPYYLRSSNLEIKCIGTYTPNENWNGDHILMYSYINP